MILGNDKKYAVEDLRDQSNENIEKNGSKKIVDKRKKCRSRSKEKVITGGKKNKWEKNQGMVD